ncbi:hypothetical protein J2Z21_004638 [Streptomyces griseochromogenes]|uniref:Uncharacterized protein n=1 Tax=Streptomyces griseochromogenes TaxID=68214 RepID=A0A1B1ATE4_9ACTN|nr:hypothetical protein [Streptomyces griseochromogenes]ANP49846.1 hypothetical protein AVL59_09675 [Streptomyces griseochromogenes]MBP2051661.1 hypothetical protein [Streptomyces griseochromogenes]
MTDKHKADMERVSAENNFTDVARGLGDQPSTGGLFFNPVEILRSFAKATPYGQAMVKRTEFDDYDLNAMIDLVEQTNPEDLESSGRALWDARDAIKAAADTLKGKFDTVPWVGKAGDDFRTWGGNLVTHAHGLADFAGGAGDSIATAAEGLASVRNAMKIPRDTRAVPARPEKFTAAEKVSDKEGYATAVKVEKHRQEAVNQMNRLASYYAVSTQSLQELHKSAPDFGNLPNVGVPHPKSDVSAPQESASHGHQSTGTSAVVGHHATVEPVHHAVLPDASGVPAPVHHATATVPVRHPEAPVGTHIDSTGTLPPPTTTTPGPSHTPPVTGTPPTGGSQPNVFDGGGFRLPMPNPTSGRNVSGAGGFRNPPTAQGRAGTSELTNPGSGRSTGRGPMDQMGRATSTGQSAVKGTGSGPRTTSPMGRGVTGGTPRPAGTPASHATNGPTTGAGRTNGVVGGRPSTTNPSSKNGSRIPRGTVVGGEEEANSRPTTGRLGQRGVFGTPESESTPRPGSGTTGSRARAGTSEAVTGRPSERTSAAGAERNGMTRGGAGLTRGAGQNGRHGGGRKTDGTSRPDYLVEDEETHLPNSPRRDVPPVIN